MATSIADWLVTVVFYSLPVHERFSSRVVYRLSLCAVWSVAGTFTPGQIVNIVDSLTFSMALSNLIAIYLLLPELRADLASYWQRVVVRAEGKVHVA